MGNIKVTVGEPTPEELANSRQPVKKPKTK